MCLVLDLRSQRVGRGEVSNHTTNELGINEIKKNCIGKNIQILVEVEKGWRMGNL